MITWGEFDDCFNKFSIFVKWTDEDEQERTGDPSAKHVWSLINDGTCANYAFQSKDQLNAFLLEINSFVKYMHIYGPNRGLMPASKYYLSEDEKRLRRSI